MSDTEVRLILLPVGEDSISVEFAVNSSEIEAEAAIVEAAIVEPAIVEPAIAEHLTQEDELLISSLCRELVEDVCENEVELCISTLPGDIGAVEVSITPLVDLLLDHASEKADSRKLYTKSEFMLIGEDKALKAFPPALDLSYPGFREFDLRVTPMERAATSDILRFLGLPDDDDPIQSLKPMWATNNRAGFAPGARQPAQQPSKQLGGLPTRPPPGFPPQQNGPIRSRLIEDGNMPETNTPRDRRFGAPKLTDMAKGARGGAWAASSPPDKDGGGGFLGRSPPDRLRDRDGQARVAAGPPVEHEMVQRGGDRVDARGSMDRGHGDRWGNDPKKPGDNWRQAIQDDRNREDRGGDRGDRGDRAPVKERWSVQRDKDAVEEVGGNDGGRRAWEMGRQDNARHDNARQDNARQDNARQDRDIANGHGMRVDAHRDDGGDKRQGGQGGQGGRRDAPQRMTAAEMETERLKMREEMAAAKAKQPVNSTTNIFGHEELNLDDLIDHEFEAKPAHQRQTGPPPGMIPPVQGVKMSFQALAQAAASGHPGAMGHAPLSKPTVAGQGGDKVLSLEELEKHIAAPKPRGGAPPGMGAPPSPAGKKQANNNASQALLGMLKKAQVQGGLQQGPQQQQLLPQQGYHAMPPQPPMPASVLSLFKQIDEGMQLPGGGGGGAQPNAAPGFGGAQPNASQGFGGAQPNGTHGFGGAHPNGTQGFGGAQPNASPGFGGAQPNTAPGFGGAQPYGTQGFGGAQPNTAPGFGGDQPNTAPGFGGAQPNGTQGFGGAQPNTAPGFGGAQPNATQGFGGGQSNAPSPAPGGGAAGPAKSTIPKDILAAFGGGGGGTNNGAANKGAASGLSSLMSIWSAGPLPPPPLQKEGGSGGGAATTAAATTSGAHQSMGSFGSVAQLWNSQTHSGGGGDMGGGGGGGGEGGGAGGGGAGGSLADLFARATTLQPTSTAQYGQGQAPHMPPPHTQGQGQAQGTPADALQNLLRGLAASQAGGGHHMGGTSGHMPQSQAHPQHMHHQQQQHHNPQQQQQAQLLQHLLANAQQQQQQQQSLAAPGAQQTQQRMQLLMMQHQMQQQQLQQQQQAALQAMLTGAGHNAGGQGGGMGQNQNAQLLFLAQQRMQQQQMQQQQQQQNAQLLAQMAGGGGAQQQQQQQGGMGMPGGGGGAKGTDPSNLMRFFESQSNYNLGQAPPMSQAKARPGGGALPTARNVAELEQILGQRR